MYKKTALLLSAVLGLAVVAHAASLTGREVEAKLKGNTAKVYNTGCHDDEPTEIWYFRDDGSVTARFRSCNLPMDRARSETGGWEIHNNRFCIRKVADFDDICFGLNELGDDTYRLVFFNPVMRQAWTVVVIDEGNTYNLK